MTTPLVDPNAGYAAIIQQYLSQWGLTSLAPLVTQLGQSGASNDQITLQIQQSPEYQTRFAGNAARVAKGLGVLDPATYVALEGQYRQILSQLPRGFYDSKDSIDNFIGGDVSPSELSDRVSIANQAYVNAPQEARDAWDAYHPNAGPGGAVAAILDTGVAEPLIQQQAQAAGIGGAALQQGLALTQQATALKAAQQGVTIDQARKAYSEIAQRLPSDQASAQRFLNPATSSFGQADEESASLLGDAAATQKRNLLGAEESAQFNGKGGASDTAGSPGSNY